MQIALYFSAVTAIVAVLGVLVQALVYAYREGKKEARLAAVEDRVKNLPQLEALVTAINASIENLKLSVSELKSDIRTDVAEINHTLRNHLFARGGDK
jgi:hypothetical protein